MASCALPAAAQGRATIWSYFLSSVANSLARALEKRLRAELDAQPLPGRFDGVVALPHTEDGLAMRRHGDGAPGRPHHKAHHAQSPHEVSANHALLCRTLVGLLTHPNVGAAIVLETAEDAARYASVRGLSDGGGADAVGSSVDRGATSSSISSISSISSSISTPGGVCYATITASASESGLSSGWPRRHIACAPSTWPTLGSRPRGRNGSDAAPRRARVPSVKVRGFGAGVRSNAAVRTPSPAPPPIRCSPTPPRCWWRRGGRWRCSPKPTSS